MWVGHHGKVSDRVVIGHGKVVRSVGGNLVNGFTKSLFKFGGGWRIKLASSFIKSV